jgi:F-type H+-transporting ATPase subunit delta
LSDTVLAASLQAAVDAVVPDRAAAESLLTLSDLLRGDGLESADLKRKERVAAGGRGLSEALDDAGVRMLWRTVVSDSARVRADLSRLIVAIEGDAELAAALSDPTHSTSARQALVVRLLGDGATEVAVALAKLAVSRPEQRVMRNLQHYLDIAADLHDSLRATVTTAIELDKSQLAKLAAELKRIYGADVDLFVKIDPKVIGGVRVEIAGDVIDGSLSTRIARAEQAIGR